MFMYWIGAEACFRQGEGGPNTNKVEKSRAGLNSACVSEYHQGIACSREKAEVRGLVEVTPEGQEGKGLNS